MPVYPPEFFVWIRTSWLNVNAFKIWLIILNSQEKASSEKYFKILPRLFNFVKGSLRKSKFRKKIEEMRYIFLSWNHLLVFWNKRNNFSDIFPGNTLDDLDHAVLAVGYGTLKGEPYWLVRNSWSTYWGNDGYVLMSMRNNNCGVETFPTYVVL